MDQSADRMISASDVPMQVPGLISRREPDGNHMLFNPDTMCAHLISEWGWAVVQLCTGSNTVEHIAVQLASNTGETVDRLRQPVAGFVMEMYNRRLLLINDIPARSV